jgi:predicted RNase H-like HicB family nuclease
MWARAAKIAKTYTLVMQPEPRLGYFGRTVEFPYVMADGKTLAACAEQVLEATTLAVVTYLERDQQPPGPAGDGRRDQQLNIRVSGEERLMLDGIAAREGFRSVSDYVRAAALKRVG